MKAIILLLLLGSIHAVSAQFVNGGFDQWDTVGMYGQPYLDPTGWTTVNNNSFFGIADTPVTQGKDSTGFYARIESDASGIDALLPGWLWQTIPADHLDQIEFDCKCDSISLAGSCIVKLYKKSTNALLYTDSIKTEDLDFHHKTINILPEWDLQQDSITLWLEAYGLTEYMEDSVYGYSVFFVDNVSASYISSTGGSLSKDDIVLHPNPSNGIVNLLLERDADFLIRDISGKQMTYGHFHSGQNTLQLEVPPGMYFLIVKEDAKHVATEKIVVMR